MALFVLVECQSYLGLLLIIIIIIAIIIAIIRITIIIVLFLDNLINCVQFIFLRFVSKK